MNRKSGSGKLSVLMLLFGIAALALRKALYAVAVDVKGLLLRNHPLEIGLAALTAVVLLVVAWIVRKLDYEERDSANLPAAFGTVAAGAGILATVLTATPLTGGYLEILWHYLGLAAPVCLLLAGIARGFGKKPFFLLYVVVCLFFLVHIVTRYQHWSSNPQMQDYVFALLGAMAILLFGFYSASLGAGCGGGPKKVGMGLAAVYLCLAELARSACPALYLGSILWVLKDLRGAKIQLTNHKK